MLLSVLEQPRCSTSLAGGLKIGVHFRLPKRLVTEERKRKWEIERREMDRKEAERRRIEREAQREKEIVGTISNWRMARRSVRTSPRSKRS
jgi:hypothetical protein